MRQSVFRQLTLVLTLVCSPEFGRGVAFLNTNDYHLRSMKETDPQSKEPKHGAIRTLQAPDLFAGQREIVIQHQGVSYRLRITRNDKLILCK